MTSVTNTCISRAGYDNIVRIADDNRLCPRIRIKELPRPKSIERPYSWYPRVIVVKLPKDSNQPAGDYELILELPEQFFPVLVDLAQSRDFHYSDNPSKAEQKIAGIVYGFFDIFSDKAYKQDNLRDYIMTVTDKEAQERLELMEKHCKKEGKKPLKEQLSWKDQDGKADWRFRYIPTGEPPEPPYRRPHNISIPDQVNEEDLPSPHVSSDTPRGNIHDLCTIL